jgi:geranylgeranyl diphosphate synthase type I
VEYLYRHRQSLRIGLDNFIADKKQFNDETSWLKDFLQRLDVFMQGGKHMRGNLVCYIYTVCCGKEPSEKVLNAAIALELMHAGLVIQDDIIDQDDRRRGKPSIHHQYRLLAEQRKLADAKSFGETMAICASDMTMFFAYELLSASCNNLKAVSELLAEFTKSLTRVCEGQMQDIYYGASPIRPDKPAIFDLMRLKTASYSLALPMVMGSILAGASKNRQDSLRNLGLDIGIIFQIRDDELGALGDTKSLGKPVGSDIREGKKTLLHYYLFKNCSKAEKKRLDAIFGNDSADNEDIKYVQNAMKSHKIPELLARDITELRNAAFLKIDKLKLPGSTKRELKDLVSFCATRNT